MQFHEIANKFPMMSDTEIEELAKDIAKNGLLDPITLFEEKILDGRNRYAACEIAEVEPDYVEFEGNDPWAFVWSKNKERRHLTSSQIAAISLDFERHFAEEAKARQGARNDLTLLKDFSNVNRNDNTAAEATAKAMGTNAHYVADAKRLEREAPDLLEKVKAGDLSITQARRELVRQTAQDAPPLPTGKYRVIYADPPWAYGNTQIDGFKEQRDHYPVMSLEDICAMPIEDMAEDNAILFLWTTSPMLREAFDVVDAWGFEYKTSFVWDKVGHVMGHYNSVRHEFLLVCVRGSCQPDVRKLFDSVVTEERTEHSKKPEAFRQIIETLYTVGSKLELFGREEHEGWTVYGNEVVS